MAFHVGKEGVAQRTPLAGTNAGKVYTAAKTRVTEAAEWLSNPATGPLEGGIPHLAGAALIAYGFYKMGNNLMDFYGGASEKYWTGRGWYLPQQFARNFMPEPMAGSVSDDFPQGRFEDKNGNPIAYGSMSRSTPFLDWGNNRVVWSVPSNTGADISYEETLEEFTGRTGNLFMPADAYEATIGSDEHGSLKYLHGLDFNPSYVMIAEDGVMFAGSKNKRGAFKNSKFIEYSAEDQQGDV
tara:strand:- start:300 stop:1019 length:720 start_codon:yes stop_codon:yes gene_type:complete